MQMCSISGALAVALFCASKKLCLWQNCPSICPFMLADVKSDALTSLESKAAYNLCLTWYWTSMLCSIDSCQNRVTADLFQMTAPQAHFYNSLRLHFFFKVPCWPVIGFQLITGSGPVFSGGIQFVSILCWKLNEVRRILFKNLTRVLLLALANPIYCYFNLLVDGRFWASPLFSWLV